MPDTASGAINMVSSLTGGIQINDGNATFALTPSALLHSAGQTFNHNGGGSIINNGTNPGITCNQLIAGQANPGGTLDVQAVNGFFPHVGDTFDVVLFGSGSSSTPSPNRPRCPSCRSGRWRCCVDSDGAGVFCLDFGGMAPASTRAVTSDRPRFVLTCPTTG